MNCYARFLMTTCAAIGMTIVAVTAGETLLKVTGDNVSLRARPTLSAEVIGRVNIGDTLTGIEQQGEWFRVALPSNIACWVATEFITNGIAADRVNARCGPGRNFNSLGILDKGTKIEIRQQKEKWIQIAPLPGLTAWITTAYVIGSQTAPQTPPVTPVTPVPVMTTNAPAAIPPPPPPPDLKPQLTSQPLQGQAGTGWEGILESSGIFKTGPAKFRLIRKNQAGEAEIVCYLRGNQDQLASFKGRKVRIQGREYWLKETKEPVVVPESIIPME